MKYLALAFFFSCAAFANPTPLDITTKPTPQITMMPDVLPNQCPRYYVEKHILKCDWHYVAPKDEEHKK